MLAKDGVEKVELAVLRLHVAIRPAVLRATYFGAPSVRSQHRGDLTHQTLDLPLWAPPYLAIADGIYMFA